MFVCYDIYDGILMLVLKHAIEVNIVANQLREWADGGLHIYIYIYIHTCTVSIHIRLYIHDNIYIYIYIHISH